MASGGPVMNGDISRSPSQTGAVEGTLRQMNILIQENRDLKEALQKANMSMKERFEGLAAWKEKQKEEKDFLQSKLNDTKVRIESLTVENQDLRKKLETQGADTQGSEIEALRAQVTRLQAEKNDLVALNSELQLKAEHSSNDDSFIEIIKVTDGGAGGVSDACGTEHMKGLSGPSLNLSMSASRIDSEEATVSQLLQSLRDETQRAERLQEELLQAKINYSKLYSTLKDLENKKSDMEQSTQTTEPEETKQQAAKAASEVENLKSQVMTLYKHLQQAQSKLDEAEGMKKNLTDRCREVEQDVATLKAQLVDRQTVQSENDRLKLQLDSMQAQSMVEQRKAGEERNNLAQLKEAYTKLFEDYNEMKEERKKREEKSHLEQREVLMDLEEKLGAAEKALVAKQEQIDQMKQELYEKEKELETINLFKLQAEVYSSDFHAERAAREKIHEEKERLAAQLEFVKMQNTQLQEEMDSLGRHSLNEMQRRHGGGNQPSLVGRGAEWQQGNIPEHACPKCNEILPDLDSLQIHIMDCIN